MVDNVHTASFYLKVEYGMIACHVLKEAGIISPKSTG
jgi:hypothetical protein